jgi:hypothetical protein
MRLKRRSPPSFSTDPVACPAITKYPWGEEKVQATEKSAEQDAQIWQFTPELRRMHRPKLLFGRFTREIFDP